MRGRLFNTMRITVISQLLPNIAIIAVLSLPACSTKNVHPDIEYRARYIHTIGIVVPRVSVYRLTAGGMAEFVEEWSEDSRNNLLSAVVEQLSGRITNFVMLEHDTLTVDVLDEVFAQYEAVAASIYGRVYIDEPLFTAHPKRFEYSVGSVDDLTAGKGIDALLIVTGYDEISTYGRKALIAVGKITGILFGAPPHKGATVVSMALLDRDGTILWCGELRELGNFDLRDSRSAYRAVRKILSSFPPEVR